GSSDTLSVDAGSSDDSIDTSVSDD
ncbi:unnamed protein product, partial [Allacma fusca]